MYSIYTRASYEAGAFSFKITTDFPAYTKQLTNP